MRLLEVIVFCFGGQKAFVFLGLVFGGLSYLVNVACSSILSKQTPFHEQVCTRQTRLAPASGLITAV